MLRPVHQALVMCLEEFDPSVKESAAWALGCVLYTCV